MCRPWSEEYQLIHTNRKQLKRPAVFYPDEHPQSQLTAVSFDPERPKMQFELRWLHVGASAGNSRSIVTVRGPAYTISKRIQIISQSGSVSCGRCLEERGDEYMNSVTFTRNKLRFERRYIDWVDYPKTSVPPQSWAHAEFKLAPWGSPQCFYVTHI